MAPDELPKLGHQIEIEPEDVDDPVEIGAKILAAETEHLTQPSQG